ncbi:MAG TPA: PEP-CTERM sorting domain-containing protein [Accumulibacter sp.]|nr:PEP-CTERM sorting domain-containing protein [Accumulibacter sp.]
MRLKLLAALAMGMSLAGGVQAANFNLFYGLDQRSGGGPRPNSDAAHASFLGALNGANIGIETFEDNPLGSFLGGAVRLDFAGTALTGNLRSLSTLQSDIYASTRLNGSRVLNADTHGRHDYFDLTFSAPVVAFGFYGHSFSDYAAFGIAGLPPIQITIDGGYPVDVVNLDPLNIQQNSVNFFGLISDTPFTTVRMTNPVSFEVDGVFLDDITVATPGANVPEPASLLLALLGLGSLGLMRRRD